MSPSSLGRIKPTELKDEPKKVNHKGEVASHEDGKGGVRALLLGVGK